MEYPTEVNKILNDIGAMTLQYALIVLESLYTSDNDQYAEIYIDALKARIAALQ